MFTTPRASRALGSALLTLTLLSTLTVAAEARTLRPVEMRFAPASWYMRWAHATAVEYWRATPCHGDVTTRWARLPVGIEAESRWMALAPHLPSTWSDCVVTFNSRSRFTRVKLCSVMVHEMGHLLGQEHVAGSRHVMSERYSGAVAGCRRPGWH